MFAQTQDLEFGQGQSRDVPDRELALNNIITILFVCCDILSQIPEKSRISEINRML